jgi:hypothetical protein
MSDQEIPDVAHDWLARAYSEYAVQTRYPGDWEPVSETEARHALELAAIVYSWVNEKL